MFMCCIALWLQLRRYDIRHMYFISGAHCLHVCRSSTSMTAANGKETSASLQQRMQQALTADIAPSGAPRPMPTSLQRQGGASGSGMGSEGGNSMREEDTGFWDLVYILYPEFAESAGVTPLRELVPHCSLLERTLMVLALVSIMSALATISVMSQTCYSQYYTVTCLRYHTCHTRRQG